MNVAEQLFYAEVGSPNSTVRSVAVCYALLIAYASGRLRSDSPVDAEFWRRINAAVNDRFGWKLPQDVRKIDRLRKAAWDIHGAACEVRGAA